MSRKLQLAKGCVAQDLEDKIVIFDEKTSMLHTLNETASYTFRKIKSGWDESKIAVAVSKRYGIPVTRAGKDVNMFLNNLKRKKILSPVTHAKAVKRTKT